MAFAAVIFAPVCDGDGESTAPVAASWLVEDRMKCYYPNNVGRICNTMVKNLVPVDLTNGKWELYDIIKYEKDLGKVKNCKLYNNISKIKVLYMDYNDDIKVDEEL